MVFQNQRKKLKSYDIRLELITEGIHNIFVVKMRFKRYLT